MNAVLNLLLNAHQSDLNWLKLIHYNIQCNDQLVLFITFNIYLLARKLYSREFLNISYIPESLLKSWKSPNINCNILWGTGFWSFRPNFYLQIGTSNETLPLPPPPSPQLILPLDAGSKLNVHKIFRRRPGRLMYIQFMSFIKCFTLEISKVSKNELGKFIPNFTHK